MYGDRHPLYKHDCDDCIYLGAFGLRDLYYCPSGVTLVARRTSDGPDYTSGIGYVGRNEFITEAFKRAYERGLIEVARA